MKLKVFHAREPNFRDDKPQEFNDINFELVALVECQELGEVFYLTNHVDHDWWAVRSPGGGISSIRSIWS